MRHLIRWIIAVGMSLTCCAAVAMGAAAETQRQEAPGKQDWVFHACEDIRAISEDGTAEIAQGTVTFTGAIQRTNMAALFIAGDTVMTSPAGIDTMNLLFVTNHHARALFSAPTVSLKQDKRRCPCPGIVQRLLTQGGGDTGSGNGSSSSTGSSTGTGTGTGGGSSSSS
eukprot:g12984.t1